MSLIDRIRNKITGILSPHFLGREQIALVEMSGAVLEEAQEQTDESIAGVQAQIDVLRSEEGAGLIGIEDAGGHFTAINVEGALEELASNTGNFNPASSYTITGEWEFAQPISLLDGAFGLTLVPEVLSDDRVYSLQDASGTLAFLSDIPAPTPEVQIVAGANVDVTGSFPSYTISVPNISEQVDLIAGSNVDITGTYPSYTISVPNIPQQVNLIAGSNVNITGTYPNLTISASGGGGDGGGDVTSVNGQVGDVVLNYSNVGAAAATHTHTIAQVSGLQTALNGKANASHTHSAGDITSGVFATSRLGTGAANTSTFLRGDGTWAAPPEGGGGGGGGTVTSVRVESSGIGLTFTGNPINTSGTITGTLSTNLQSWSGINPSTKANTNSVVTTTGNQTGIGGNKSWTGEQTHSGNIHVGKSNAVITVGAGTGAVSGGIANYGNPGVGDVALFSEYGGGTVRLRPDGRSSTVGQLLVTPSSITWNGNSLYHTGNPPPITAHTHAAGDITSGTFNAARIPNLNASKITAGTLAVARIPSLSSLYVTTSGNQTGIGGNKTFTGNITAANVTATSDVRLKEDIEACPGRKKLLEALRHYRWKWKESGEPGIGVLAQEVQKHAPEYVHEDEEGVLSVDKAGLALEMMFAMIDVLEEFDGSSN